MFEGKFDLKGHGQGHGHQFFKQSKTLDDQYIVQVNGSEVVTFTSNHTKFLKFQGQFDLEGQGHQFSKPSETFRCLVNSSSWKVKSSSSFKSNHVH